MPQISERGVSLFQEDQSSGCSAPYSLYVLSVCLTAATVVFFSKKVFFFIRTRSRLLELEFELRAFTNFLDDLKLKPKVCTSLRLGRTFFSRSDLNRARHHRDRVLQAITDLPLLKLTLPFILRLAFALENVFTSIQYELDHPFLKLRFHVNTLEELHWADILDKHEKEGNWSALVDGLAYLS